MIGKVRLYRSGGYDPDLGSAVIDLTLEPKGRSSLLPSAYSELRRLYWNQREVRGEIEQSRTHLYPLDRQTALCGQSLPQGDMAEDVMWDDTDNPEHLCQRCVKIANKEEHR